MFSLLLVLFGQIILANTNQCKNIPQMEDYYTNPQRIFYQRAYYSDELKTNHPCSAIVVDFNSFKYPWSEFYDVFQIHDWGSFHAYFHGNWILTYQCNFLDIKGDYYLTMLIGSVSTTVTTDELQEEIKYFQKLFQLHPQKESVDFESSAEPCKQANMTVVSRIAKSEGAAAREAIMRQAKLNRTRLDIIYGVILIFLLLLVGIRIWNTFYFSNFHAGSFWVK